MDPMLWYGLWLAISGLLSWIVFAMFRTDMARLSRREPLRIPFIGWAQPGDTTYPLAIVELFGPYVTLCAAVVFFAGFSVYLAAFTG
ncbi:MAG TPA: hypothetical protein VFW28_03680 [Micropepsaceae bacterium]|nr:hypothetical protein [Micropepsaceae bacterium]